MSDPAFFRIHSGLDREGPGDRESLDWALGQVALPPDARILDAGCGPGADIAALLAHAPRGSVVAMDSHAPFADRAARAHAGDARISVICADMADPPGRFDLIWSAGAVYFLGVTEALAAWRKALAPGGAVAFSQIAWKTAAPAAEARDFWRQYPAMCDAAGAAARVAAAGYRVVARRWLPDAAWEAYYTPLEARIAALRPGAGAELAEALAAEAAEIALWRRHRADFGYLQLVVRPE